MSINLFKQSRRGACVLESTPKRHIYRCILFGCLFSGLMSGRLVAEERPRNVILLLVDDMGYGDIAAHGNPVIKTPNFDTLHDQAARFTNFAVSSSCAPTRAALLTGRHEFLSWVTHTKPPGRDMNPDVVTIAQLFQSKGYRTGIFGKWHLQQKDPCGPWHRGFDETLTVPKDSQNSHFDPVLLENRVKKKFKGYRTDILFKAATEFIECHKDKPFFCYLPTYAPHAPHKVPEKYSEPYKAFADEYKGKKYRANFNGMIANVDENLGRLMGRLKELGIADDTLIIVMNDNGGTEGVDTFNDGRRGVKGTIWSGGTRAYSFWRWGKHFSPGPRPQMSGHVDVFPTLADLCGLNIPADLRSQLEGDSLRPVLENAGASLRGDRMQVHHVGRWDIPTLWYEHRYANSCVRWNQYTLVRIDPCKNAKCDICSRIFLRQKGIKLSYTTDKAHHRMTVGGRWELYDIDSDPFQSADIAAEHPEIVARMSAHYEEWWEKVEVVLGKRWETPVQP